MNSVCVLMPNHCSVMCFRFRAMRIYGVSVVYFQFTHLLGKPRYMGDMYLYLCTERSEDRMNACVLFTRVVCGLMMKGRAEVKPGAGR